MMYGKSTSIIAAEQMDIAEVNPLEAGLLCHFLAAKSMAAGGGGKIVQEKVGIESQQTVRNFRIQPGQVAGDTAHLLLIHIAWNQKGAGNKGRRLRTFACPATQSCKIFQSGPVAHTTQGAMDAVVPGLEIELDAPA